MRNLQHEDTGSYWCVEEIGGIFQMDEKEQLNLTVQSAPDVSVKNSSVSGHEGDNVSVQCFYTSGYQNKLKQWCRYKDKSCYTEKRTDTSQNPSVQIRDDGRSSFTVLMTGLRLSDSGWYYCSAGDLQVSVQLTVTDPNVPVLTELIQTLIAVVTTEASERNRHYGYLEAWIPVVVLLLLMVVVVVSIIILRKKRNRNNTHNTEVTRDGDSDAGNSVRSSSAVAENDVTYSSVTVRPKTKTKAFSPVSVEDEVTYSSVHKHFFDEGTNRIQTHFWKLVQIYSDQQRQFSTEGAFTAKVIHRCRCVECFSGGRNHTVTVKTGGSVTIPCHYDEKNPPQKKYWYSDNDLSNIYTNTTEENLSVIDHPDQSLFTVTMRNLQSSTHNGRYYCTVETDGKPTVTYELHLEVQSVPDVSVMNSSVSGHEGDNVSVQCFYTSGYKNKLKQWCRYKDKGCYTEKRTGTSQNSSVQISDDGRSSFTVLMTGLRLSDSGWYFCCAGKALNPVHLTVTEAEPDDT
ncbi:unnamed protein product [Leuciscus chuanchicus]